MRNTSVSGLCAVGTYQTEGWGSPVPGPDTLPGNTPKHAEDALIHVFCTTNRFPNFCTYFLFSPLSLCSLLAFFPVFCSLFIVTAFIC
jgi:hypothetical protein